MPWQWNSIVRYDDDYFLLGAPARFHALTAQFKLTEINSLLEWAGNQPISEWMTHIAVRDVLNPPQIRVK